MSEHNNKIKIGTLLQVRISGLETWDIYKDDVVMFLRRIDVDFRDPSINNCYCFKTKREVILYGTQVKRFLDK